MDQPYDAIIVGARCAGAAAALLLARKGYHVLVVDQARFPSDTVSTHLIHPQGVTALERWGLLDRLVATGCPPIHTYAFDMGPFVIRGTPGDGRDLSAVAYGPRRTVFDQMLVAAAAEAGAEIREGYTVSELVFDDGRVTGIRGHASGASPGSERARVVIGADGLRSLVARAVSAERYHEKPPLQAGYYSYWSGVPLDGEMQAFDVPRRGIAAWPTNDDLTLIVACWPYAEFETNKRDVEGAFLRTLEGAPAFAERVRAGRREERFSGMAVPNFFRKPFGPGWALVGDAGYNRDFITAHGMSDALLGAEMCAAALDDAFSGRQSFDAAMGRYQQARDEHALPRYEFTAQFAALEPPPPEMQQLMRAISGSQDAMNGFVRTFAGVLSPADFFSEENIGRIFAAAAPPGTPA
jgi:2-polyprenyl-6-methoxyphenol hydroxylase-like FAD-dependent oxidoreductase